MAFARTCDWVSTLRYHLFMYVSIRAVPKVLSRLRGSMSKLDTSIKKGLNETTDDEEKLPREIVKQISVLGHLDMRMRLDKSISSRNNRYAASLSMMAAKLSYEEEEVVEIVVTDYWKMEFLGALLLWNDFEKKHTTHAIMFYDKNADLIVVAFRGTSPLDADAWISDVDFEWYELQGMGNTHCGFMRALGLKGKYWPKPKDVIDEQYLAQQPAYYTMRQKLRVTLNDGGKKTKFIVTGHSLGGALAILFVSLLAYHDDTWLFKRLEGVYTFGQPRVGDEMFAKNMKKKMREYGVKYLRYVYCNDVVPRVPFDNESFKFKHFGRCLYFDSCYRGQLVWEEPNKNYFSWRWEIPKHLISDWELIRGFIIQYTKGPDYKEGWFMILVRLLGLLFPGLSAHSPQDYVNVTRLGSLPFNLQNIIHDPRFKCD